ncbi:MAG TPA: tail fiber domain-containing protein [Candidatus Elarobacter sp.]|nr:tail fiber domain-containing protein [Candidatus Elarobacter sp.]
MRPSDVAPQGSTPGAAAFTAPAAIAIAAGAVRRTQGVVGCSGFGTGAFDGVPANGNVANATDTVVVGGSNDHACDDYAAVVGGYYDQISSGSNAATYSFIGGGYSNTIDAGTYSAIAGGLANAVTGGGNAKFIGGGGYNTASGDGVAIGSGTHNAAAGGESFIGGGEYNTISAAGSVGAIAGGEYNTVSGQGAYVGTGGYNTASGLGAVIDGGFNSTAAGTFATIPGGYVNNAAGTYSFAAGARASAAQTGTFVWSDGSDGDTILTSSRAYQFLARASGGVTFWTNAASTVGATLAPGSGTWASASDRNLKTDVAPVDNAAILAKVSALPISRWSYKSERGVRHVGPMAQDFYAAFGVGEDDKHITSVDEDGVALTAIKALHAENGALHAENARLRADLAALRSQQGAHDRRVDAELTRLETAVEAAGTR